MSITIWDLFKYLFKWKILIIAVLILSFVAATLYVDSRQTYSAKVIIQYNDSCISDGKTLDGNLFDANEIKAPKVILNVLQELGYENKKIESVRENISISPITPKTVENLKEAKEKLGEEYQFFPKTFTITYKGNSSFEATRDILTSVIANYFKYYSETYLYLATLTEVDYSLNQKDFDYLEQAEQIKENLKHTVESLSNYARDSTGYRSPTTGLTFDDLLKDFERIEEFTMPNIFSKIYEGQVTKDKALLISKYTERRESDVRERENLEYKASLTNDRLDAYVEANKRVPNAYNEEDGGDGRGNSAYIIQEVEYDHESTIDETTTYDALITSYANDSVAANNKKIDAEYCSDIIERFSAEKNAGIDYAQYENDVKTSIDEVLERLEGLYQKANRNISDYNAYIPALHIKKLSGVSYYGNISGSVYKLIALVGAFAVSCIGVFVYEIIKKYSTLNTEKEGGEADVTGEDDDGGVKEEAAETSHTKKAKKRRRELKAD